MERNYATQMDAARRGIVTPELKKVAEKEYMAVEDLMPLVASGKVAIPANKLHTCRRYSPRSIWAQKPSWTCRATAIRSRSGGN